MTAGDARELKPLRAAVLTVSDTRNETTDKSGALLADRELAEPPTHLTIVGPKDAPESKALFAMARALPAAHKRLDWWDSREGRLANPDVDYPDFPDGPAAFACTSTFCSYPVTQASEIAGQLDNLKRARKF